MRIRRNPSTWGSTMASGERETPSIWDSSEAWAACAKALREYDEDMIQDWKEEIDTLLVFAGLFSAVVTAFNIESYQLLQQQPEDAVVTILAQISAQLSSFSVDQQSINTTIPANVTDVPPFRPSTFAVRLNALWFSSLVCGLLSASLGLLVKQWLREYLAGSSNVSRESIRIRQFRYEGLRKWHVPLIILCLPILLQAALVLFLVGLLDFLWNLHRVVAAIITVIVAVILLFAAATNIFPLIRADCPYKSPLSWALCVMVQSTKRFLVSLATHFHQMLSTPSPAPVLPQPNAQPANLATPIPWMSRPDLSGALPSRLSESLRAWLSRLASTRSYSSWKEREKLFTTETGQRAAVLDDATLAGADEMFMDDAFLHAVVRPCMRDIAPRAAFRCVNQILFRRAPRMLDGLPYWEPARSLDARGGDTGPLTLMHLLLDVLHRLNQSRMLELELDGDDDEPGENLVKARETVLRTMHRLVRALPGPAESRSGALADKKDSQTYALFRRMFEVLAGVVDAEVGQAIPERYILERSFNLMLKLFPRFQAVGPTCILAFCAYSRQTRIQNAPYRFMQACSMIVRASALLARDSSRAPSLANANATGGGPAASETTPFLAEPISGHQEELSNDSALTLYDEPHSSSSEDGVESPEESVIHDEYGFVRPAVLKVLDDLKDFLSTAMADTAEFRPTTAMLAECAQALLALAARDRPAISPGLVDALSNMVWLASAACARDEGGHDWHVRDGYDSCRGREDQETHLAKQATKLLRRMYGVRMLEEINSPWREQV
ncbi:hypothetical protein C8Q80DRAFT_1302830 [Daedaleopsis nitida]|nr:hypothetical protein C8Q80DRAFT_1302830 [Daedaleopsis nitida]